MPFKCSVSGCRSNYKNELKSSIFQFPRNEILRQEWIKAIPKKDFKTHKRPRVCELHFEPSQILREASAFDPRTGRTLTASLRVPRLRKDAVPTLFMSPPATLKSRMGSKKLASRKQKNKPKESVKKGTEKSDDGQQTKSLENDLGTDFQTAGEPLCAVKQEPDESVDEPTQLIIGKVDTEESIPSSISSFSKNSTSGRSYASSIPLVPENSLPISNPDSTNMEETLTTHVPIKPGQKRKINTATPDAVGAYPDASQAKFKRRAKPSMPSKGDSECKRHVPSGISKKSRRHSTSPNKNGENATKEIFQSLVDGSENNLFGSRTAERPGDLFDVFADFIADKLREMDWDDCAYALRAILDIVFKAGKVQHDSEVDSDSSYNTSSLSSDEE